MLSWVLCRLGTISDTFSFLSTVISWSGTQCKTYISFSTAFSQQGILNSMCGSFLEHFWYISFVLYRHTFLISILTMLATPVNFFCWCLPPPPPPPLQLALIHKNEWGEFPFLISLRWCHQFLWWPHCLSDDIIDFIDALWGPIFYLILTICSILKISLCAWCIYFLRRCLKIWVCKRCTDFLCRDLSYRYCAWLYAWGGFIKSSRSVSKWWMYRHTGSREYSSLYLGISYLYINCKICLHK